jgi:hypothetical protein
MILWLDDVRDPSEYGWIGAVWAKTPDEAKELLLSGKITYASLDHDLTERATLGWWDGEFTGYELVLWMEENKLWPPKGVGIHSHSVKGRARMEVVLKRNGVLVDETPGKKLSWG